MNLEEVINKAVEKSVKEAILAAHPVGSFYFSDNDANPAEVFGGGVWQRIEGAFLFGRDTAPAMGQAVGGRGGSYTHTLSESEMPKHYHDSLRYRGPTGNKFGCNAGSLADTEWTIPWSAGKAQDYYVTGYTGDSQPHNNMPPYYLTNLWKRIA